jgi:hypothetical protein
MHKAASLASYYLFKNSTNNKVNLLPFNEVKDFISLEEYNYIKKGGE